MSSDMNTAAGPARDLILAALADAAAYRAHRAAGYCLPCAASPGAHRCGEHARDLAQADRYRALAAGLASTYQFPAPERQGIVAGFQLRATGSNDTGEVIPPIAGAAL